MKATLEFTLPEEQTEHRMAVSAPDVFAALREFDNQLRSWVKHGHEFKDADEALHAARDRLHIEIGDRNVPWDLC